MLTFLSGFAEVATFILILACICLPYLLWKKISTGKWFPSSED